MAASQYFTLAKSLIKEQCLRVLGEHAGHVFAQGVAAFDDFARSFWIKAPTLKKQRNERRWDFNLIVLRHVVPIRCLCKKWSRPEDRIRGAG
jgi:hypothetical protein